MSEGLGLWLRRTRETRQLTLEDVEKALRIRRRYLQALELGDYKALPGEIQARGFLRNYVRFLGLPVDEALARYDAEVQGHPVQPRARPAAEDVQNRTFNRPSVFAPPPTEEEERAPASAIPDYLTLGLIVAAVFLILVFITSFVLLQIVENEALAEPPEATSVPVDVVSPALTPTPTAGFVPAAENEVSVQLVPQEHAWVSVSADENIIFQGVASPGNVIQAEASEIIIVATGNGGAFQLYVNGTDWGLLGEQGEVVRRAWTPQGEAELEGS